MDKRFGTIQVDLDGAWVIQNLLGRGRDLKNDALFECGVLAFLDLFKEFGIKATFFVNAMDLEVDWKRDLLNFAVSCGHEIANHGLNHKYLAGLSSDEKRREIKESTERLRAFLKGKVYGFRAPGYSIDMETVGLLKEYDYRYDSSVFPTLLLPILMASLKSVSCAKDVVYSQSILSPLRPYVMSPKNIFQEGDNGMIEIPVSVIPIFRLPIHFSYAMILGRPYFTWGFNLIKAMNLTPNFIFHLIDLVKEETLVNLKTRLIPRISYKKRSKLAHFILERFIAKYHLLTTLEFSYNL